MNLYAYDVVAIYPPAKKLGDPPATEVHAVMASPILPHPLLLMNTDEDPIVIGAA